MNPVVLIHGLNDTVTVFEQMADYLTSLGWSVYRLNLNPNRGNQKLEILAQQVQYYIETTFKPEQSIDLVGFSMGGIVTRYYLQRLGGINRVKRYINIGTPNQGTVTAYLLPNQGICQMRPDCTFLKELNQDRQELLKNLRVTTLWSDYDLMIVPARSSRMGIGKEQQIPVLFHSWLLSDRRVLKALAEALSEPLDD
ncbi:triacylglycerol lipase [Gloeocapsa sp. PCC 73106]|uniref:esterase/lipase family protein n=1 Tax=Gloeocapsa sp. PCC 73106 TaxID=102232 RepID=UPI001181AA91|nr:triacylglycerol lipase [Gloeocapsa sp. PCC 73106]